jgi:hypothetical protein
MPLSQRRAVVALSAARALSCVQGLCTTGLFPLLPSLKRPFAFLPPLALCEFSFLLFFFALDSSLFWFCCLRFFFFYFFFFFFIFFATSHYKNS